MLDEPRYFSNVSITKIELRSAAMSSVKKPLIWRYFIEGKII